MPGADGAFRTDDMTLAVVLALAGYTYRVEAIMGRYRKWANWVFDDLGGETGEIIATYAKDQWLVEPRAFVQMMAKVREEMYVAVGKEDRRHGTKRDAPSAAAS